MARILIVDPIASEGVDLLRAEADVDVKIGLKPAIKEIGEELELTDPFKKTP